MPPKQQQATADFVQDLIRKIRQLPSSYEQAVTKHNQSLSFNFFGVRSAAFPEHKAAMDFLYNLAASLNAYSLPTTTQKDRQAMAAFDQARKSTLIAALHFVVHHLLVKKEEDPCIMRELDALYEKGSNMHQQIFVDTVLSYEELMVELKNPYAPQLHPKMKNAELLAVVCEHHLNGFQMLEITRAAFSQHAPA